MKFKQKAVSLEFSSKQLVLGLYTTMKILSKF